MTRTLGDAFRRIRSDRFLFPWNLSLLATFLIPLLIFCFARMTSQGEGYGDGEGQEYQYDQYGNRMHWWQFWKQRNYGGGDSNDGNNNGGENGEAGAPWWWFFRDDRDGEDEGRGTLVFVYLWTILMLVLMKFGGDSMYRQGNYTGIFWWLLGFASFFFIIMVLVAGLGAIRVEGRDMEETGWYGQSSVLLFLTCFFGLVTSLVFAFWLRKRGNEGRYETEKRHSLVEEIFPAQHGTTTARNANMGGARRELCAKDTTIV